MRPPEKITNLSKQLRPGIKFPKVEQTMPPVKIINLSKQLRPWTKIQNLHKKTTGMSKQFTE